MKFMIAEYYKNKNFEVLIEQHINGKPDVIVLADNKKIALEIETGNSYEIKNIEKNLKAGFDEVICVATSRKLEQEIKEKLKNKMPKSVIITSVFAFDI